MGYGTFATCLLVTQPILPSEVFVAPIVIVRSVVVAEFAIAAWLGWVLRHQCFRYS